MKARIPRSVPVKWLVRHLELCAKTRRDEHARLIAHAERAVKVSPAAAESFLRSAALLNEEIRAFSRLALAMQSSAQWWKQWGPKPKRKGGAR